MRLRRDLRREDGVAMTEFALIVPVFLFIVVGLLAFGRVFFYWIQANHLANETARWAVVDHNPYAREDASAAGRRQLDDRVPERRQGLHRLPGQDRDDPDLGDPVRVRVEKPFTVLPMISVGTITIRGTSTMRIENFADGNEDPQTYHMTDNLPSQAACS